jgi:hypothetical protein
MAIQTMTVSVTTYDGGADADPGMFQAVFERVILRHGPQAESIDIYPSDRKPDGWLEWLCRVQYRGGGALTIGAIQRQPGGEYEFHT